jgi:hypothetical protein
MKFCSVKFHEKPFSRFRGVFVRAVGQARILDQSALPMIVDSENFVERIEGVGRRKKSESVTRSKRVD